MKNKLNNAEFIFMVKVIGDIQENTMNLFQLDFLERLKKLFIEANKHIKTYKTLEGINDKVTRPKVGDGLLTAKKQYIL